MLGVGVSLEGGGIARLSDLPKNIRSEVRPAVKGAADLVGDAAAAKAGEWSTRIPEAISTAASFAASKPGATVRVSAAKAPHARAYEGTEGQSSFRHPNWNNGTWSTQATRPFLFSSAREKRPEAVALMLTALQAAIHKS